MPQRPYCDHFSVRSGRRSAKGRASLHSGTFALAIILLWVPARFQSVSMSQVSAQDLARRVISNELKFQDDHTNWMYRLEKEQYGRKQSSEIIETKQGSLS